MWDDIIKNLADFPSAVLTGVDVYGYPFSVRCKPEPDTTSKVLRVQIPDGTGIQLGPAGLLCHRHDELLWNPKSFIVLGTLEKDSKSWILRPRRFKLGASSKSWDMLKMISSGRRTAKRYLKKRGLPRPKIPWDETNALWAEAKKNK